jgi:hypothetical protein
MGVDRLRVIGGLKADLVELVEGCVEGVVLVDGVGGVLLTRWVPITVLLRGREIEDESIKSASPCGYYVIDVIIFACVNQIFSRLFVDNRYLSEK